MDDTAEGIVLVAPRVGNNVVTTHDTQFHVDFNFSCDLVVCEYYDNILLRQTVEPRIMSTSVSMDIKQLMNAKYSLRMINRELRDWPLDYQQRRDLSEFAFNATKNLIGLMPPQHNVLVIPFSVLVVSNKLVNENLAMELMTQLSMREADSRTMVPATDSSIESLEIKTTTSHESEESCPICLEDFFAGSQVLSMPCSHIFHEDCIKKWLKSSHYCPICRFEMPTS